MTPDHNRSSRAHALAVKLIDAVNAHDDKQFGTLADAIAVLIVTAGGSQAVACGLVDDIVLMVKHEHWHLGAERPEQEILS
jgi:hypothetical protein